MAVYTSRSSSGATRRRTSRGAPVSKGYDVQKQGTLAKGAAQAVAPTGTTGQARGVIPGQAQTLSGKDTGGVTTNEPGWGGTPPEHGQAELTATEPAITPDAYATPTTPAEPANPLVARNLGFNSDVLGAQAGTTQQGTDVFGKPLTPVTKAIQEAGGATLANYVAAPFSPGATDRAWEPGVQKYQKELLQKGINPETIGNAVVQRNPLGQVTGMNVPTIAQQDQMYRDRAAISAEHQRQERLAHLAMRSRDYGQADSFQQQANQIIPQLGMPAEVAQRQTLDRIIASAGSPSSISAVNPALLANAPAQFRQTAPDPDLIRQQMLKATGDREQARLKQKKSKQEEDQLEG